MRNPPQNEFLPLPTVRVSRFKRVGMSDQVSKKNPNYKAINRSAAVDPKLSLKAKGVMFYFLSKPDIWEGHLYDVVKNCKDGRKGVASAIKELKEAGYIKTIPDKKDGQFAGKHYRIFDEKIKAS